MKAIASLLRRLWVDRTGVAVIEFALAGPMVILLMFAVLQIGIAMHSYNAIRSVAAETARYAVVQYQRGQTPDVNAIELQAREIATGGSYLLRSDGFTAEVANSTIQRVDGAQEMLLTVSYAVPTVLPFVDWTAVSVDYSRPIFVLS